jgi:hypothetical protein
MQEINIAILLVALVGASYGVWLLFKSYRSRRARRNFLEIRELEVVCLAAKFWTEALCRDFRRPLQDHEVKTFYECLRTEIARSFGATSLVANFGMCRQTSGGIVQCLKADGMFTASEEGLRELLRDRIEIDHYLPLLEMRLSEDKIKIRSVQKVNCLSDWSVIFESGKTCPERVAQIGRIYRPEKAWTADDLAQ